MVKISASHAEDPDSISGRVEVFIFWTPAIVEIPSVRFCVVWMRMSGGGGDYVRIVEHVVKLMPRGIAGS